MATKVTTSLSLHQSIIVEMEPMLAMSRYALQLFDALDNLAVDQIAPLIAAHGKELCATLTNKAVSEQASFVEDISAEDGNQYILMGMAADETRWGNTPWITSICHCSSRVSSRLARIFLIPR